MSYTPTTWATGDVITADKLNNMEQGIVNGEDLFVISATNVATTEQPQTEPTLDKTFLEITNAIKGGKLVVLKITLQNGNNIFVTGATVVYNNAEISMVIFNRITCGMASGGRWQMASTGVNIASEMLLSTFSEVYLNPTT